MITQSKHPCLVNFKLGLDVTQPAFGVSEKATLKPVSSALETNYNIEISLKASMYMTLSSKRITMALIRLCGWVWSGPLLLANPEDGFSRVEAKLMVDIV